MDNNTKTYTEYHTNNNIFVLHIEKYRVYLTDFTFTRNNIEYNINIRGKGFSGQWFRIRIDGKSYVSDNVWQDCRLPKKNNQKITEISYHDINKNDIVLNLLKYTQYIKNGGNEDDIINPYIEKIQKEEEKEMERKKIKDAFWKNKKVILRLFDDGVQYKFYIVENTKNDEGERFTLIIAHDVTVHNMHHMMDDYAHGKHETLNGIISILSDKIKTFYDGDYGWDVSVLDSDCEYDSDYDPDKDRCDLFHVTVSRKNIMKSLRKYFVIKSIKNEELEPPFGNSVGKLFEMYRKP